VRLAIAAGVGCTVVCRSSGEGGGGMTDLNGTDAVEDLLGTAGSDRIYGFGGQDRLYARGGDDELYGGAGNDLLDGMAGADTMFGGPGNDTYRVDDAGDVVSEETVAGVDDGGIDTVQNSISYTLGRSVENLTLTGTAAINGTGNELANKIIGNAAANILSGGGGNDTINGGAGDDRLVGGAGKNTLTGGTGSDTFVFGPADANSTDKVVDFTAEDWVGILASDYGLSAGRGLVNDGTGKLVLDAAYFGTVSDLISVQGTVSGHGQFVYNTTTHALMWDADGAGTASSGIALAVFNSGVVLRAGNFAITTATGTGTVNQAPTAAALSNNVTSTIIPLALLALCVPRLLTALIAWTRKPRSWQPTRLH
jgi:Ca2+-binding RTX toxin-like protein